MISSLNDIKKGLNIIYNGEPHLVTEANFVRCQMRKPVMQTKMRNLINGKAVDVSFHTQDRLEEADMQRKKADYLYNDGANYFFMTQDDFEQFSISRETLGNNINYLKEGDKVDVLYFNGNPVSTSLQPKVALKVVSAPEGARGNSAQGRVTKTATLETGIEIQVPLFVKENDVVVVNTETGEYVERA